MLAFAASKVRGVVVPLASATTLSVCRTTATSFLALGRIEPGACGLPLDYPQRTVHERRNDAAHNTARCARMAVAIDCAGCFVSIALGDGILKCRDDRPGDLLGAVGILREEYAASVAVSTTAKVVPTPVGPAWHQRFEGREFKPIASGFPSRKTARPCKGKPAGQSGALFDAGRVPAAHLHGTEHRDPVGLQAQRQVHILLPIADR